jgi:hypothetical protein
LSRSSIPSALRARVVERDGGFCTWCGLAQLGTGATFHVDHVIPKSKGGSTTLENLALQCPNCSLHKADKLAARDPESAAETELFHPLREKWADHFELRADGICIGKTATGRATIEALQMNGPLMRIARALQIAMGIISASA